MRIVKLQGQEADLSVKQSGDESAFDQLFRKYYTPLTFFAQNIVNNKEVAEDLVEDAFVKLWERTEILARSGSIKSYLYTTVQNASIDHLRKVKQMEFYFRETKANGNCWEKPIIHRIIEAETIYHIYQMLETLPPKCGQVFKMFYLEDKKLQEIAFELSLSLSTVKSQKSRALKLLKRKLPNLGIVILVLFLL